jgi:hypothetical protein
VRRKKAKQRASQSPSGQKELMYERLKDRFWKVGITLLTRRAHAAVSDGRSKMCGTDVTGNGPPDRLQFALGSNGTAEYLHLEDHGLNTKLVIYDF